MYHIGVCIDNCEKCNAKTKWALVRREVIIQKLVVCQANVTCVQSTLVYETCSRAVSRGKPGFGIMFNISEKIICIWVGPFAVP